MPDAPRATFYVQHLLGIGHLARAFRIADALLADGWNVDVLVGGDVPPGMATSRATLVPLPPVRADAGGLNTLVHLDGRPFDAAAQAARRDGLLAHVAARRPDVLLIEAFPFGRRQMRFELLPLLEMVHRWPSRPLVVSSVRDILQTSHRPERVAETLATLGRFFDHVLVHGDPTLARLEQSFPAAETFAEKIRYTGLVAPDLADRAVAGNPFDIVVSAGGGAVGAALLRAAIGAHALLGASGLRWLLLAGPNLAQDTYDVLAREAGADLVLARFVPDLASVLAGARLSVSQAGYNTVADILVAGCRAVLVPYAQAGETEQTVRAGHLAKAGRAVTLAEAELDAATLAKAVGTALAMRNPSLAVQLDGARRTALQLRQDLQSHAAES